MNTEDLLKIKNIDYRYSGADLLIKCLNPEHEDNNPSLRIDKLTGKFNCFSCGFSGNLFSYFNEEQNLLNIKVQEIKQKIRKINTPKLTIPLTAIPFEQNYRNISKETYIRFNAYTLENNKEYDGRIIFPITNISDEIVLYHARYLHSDAHPKYINLPHKTEKPLFPISPDEIIKGSIILVEGFFDMLNLWDKGLKNVVCAFGSTLVSKKDRGNAKLINKFSPFKLQGVNKIFILFDSDNSGQIGAGKLKNALQSNYIVESLELDKDKDPADLTLEEITNLRDYLYDSNN